MLRPLLRDTELRQFCLNGETMVEATSKVPVLLACSNSKCERVGMQLPYYFTVSDLPKMMIPENTDVIMCPACRETRTLTLSEKESLRHLVSQLQTKK
jgi:hypothetical protein